MANEQDEKRAKDGDQNLEGADLRGADLSYAKLNGVDFTAANLNGANLTGTDLSKSNLAGVNLSEARYSTDTRWPMLFDPVASGASPLG